MKPTLTLTLLLALTACGVETVGTAATSTALKKQELEQGQKDTDQAQQAADQLNQRMKEQAEQIEKSK